ncbi:Uncharacterised protein [Candidatus Gugararchaeum adminiculabundum]|nr:Uncharacterised protein [Candidatus Gugararchaeum adminiculabundum]
MGEHAWLKAFFFVCLICSTIFAAETSASLPALPEYFQRYWNGDWVVDKAQMDAQVNGPWIDEVLIEPDNVKAIIVSEELVSSGETAPGIGKLGEAATALQKVKDVKGKGGVGLNIETVGAVFITGTGGLLGGILGGPVGAVAGGGAGATAAYNYIYKPKLLEALEKSAVALEQSDKAINAARNGFAKEMELLEQAGADNDTYSGGAKKDYTELVDELRVFGEFKEDVNQFYSYGTLGMRYARVYNSTEKIQLHFQQPDKYSITDADFKNAIGNAVGSEDNLYLDLLRARKKANSALQKMEDEYTTSYFFTQSEIERIRNETKADSEFHLLERIDERYAAFLAPGESGYSSSAGAGNPRDKVLEAEALVADNGIDSGASYLLKEAKRIADRKDLNDYYAVALKELDDSVNRAHRAETLLKDAKDAAEIMADNAERQAGSKLAAAKGIVNSQVSGTGAESDLLKEAREKIDLAAERLDYATLEKSYGKRIIACSESIAYSKEAEELVSKDRIVLANLFEETKISLGDLNGTIRKADVDGLDVKQADERLVELIAISEANPDDAYTQQAVRRDAGLVARELYSAAEERYGYLDEERGRLRLAMGELLRANPEDAKIRGIADGMNSYEQYVVDEQFAPEKALGKFNLIESTYDQAAKIYDVEIGNLLAKELKQGSRYSPVIYEGVPETGKLVNASFTLKLENDFDLYSGGAVIVVKVKVPLGVDGGDVAGKSPEIAEIIDSSGEGQNSIALRFWNVSANSEYYVKFRTETAPLSVSGQVKKNVLELGEERMQIELAVTIASTGEMENARAMIPWPGRIDSLEAYYNGMETDAVAGDGKIAVELSGVGIGKSEVRMRAVTLDPFTIRQELLEASDLGGGKARIRMNIEVENDAGIDLENVTVNIIVPINGTCQNFDLARKKNSEFTGFAPEVNSGILFVRFKIPVLLRGVTEEYELSYDVNDMESFARVLLEEAKALEANLPAGNSYEGKIDSAEILIGEKRSAEAVQQLIGIRDGLIAANSPANAEQMNYVREMIGQADAKIGPAATSARELLDKAERYFADGDYEKAKAYVSKAMEEDSRLEGIESASVFERIDSVENLLNRQKTEWLKLQLIAGSEEQGIDFSEIERLVEDAKGAATRQELNESVKMIEEAAGKISKMDETIGGKAELVYNSITDRVADGEVSLARGKELLDFLQKAAAFTEKNIDAHSYSAKKLAAKNSALKGAEESIVVLKQKLIEGEFNKTEFLAGNSALIASELKSMGSLDQTVLELEGELKLLNDSAASAINVAQVALNELKNKIGKDDAGGQKTIDDLEGVQGRAQKAYDDGRMVDSLSLSDRVLSLSNSLMPKPKQEMDLKLVAIASVSIFLLAAAAYLFLVKKEPEKPDEPKYIKRIK